MMRITTNGSLYTYKKNLLSNTNQLYSAMNKLMTHRNFDSYSADPAGATRAFKIHSSLNATNAQYANNSTVSSKFETAYQVEQSVLEIVREMGEESALGGLNNPNWSELDSYAQVLRAGADSIVQNLNGKYDEHFLFNGAETGEPPFAIVQDNGQTPPRSVLTFRGWKVDVPNNDELYVGVDGNTVTEGGRVLTNADVYQKLQDMAGETLYVDVGLGFQVDADGQVVDSTAFNSALSGLNFLDYGVDDDGDPKNMVSILLNVADIFEGYDAESDPPSWGDAGNKEDADRLVKKFEATQKHMIQQNTVLTAEANYLSTNETRLLETFDALDVERSNIEDIDDVEAITELIWAQTCYNAALQVGTNVSPQSLMDYMR